MAFNKKMDEYCSAVRKKMEVSGKWLHLEKIILSERTQTQKNKCHMLSFIFGSEHQVLRRESKHRVTTKTKKDKGSLCVGGREGIAGYR